MHIVIYAYIYSFYYVVFENYNTLSLIIKIVFLLPCLYENIIFFMKYKTAIREYIRESDFNI